MQESMVGGRDLKAGGTWLGLSLNQEFALVTNHFDPESRQMPLKSRGHLVVDVLQEGSLSAEAAAPSILRNIDDYNPFHLLCGTKDRLHYVSNVAGSDGGIELPSGVHALGNGPLLQPSSRCVRAHEKVKGMLDQVDFEPMDLLEVFYDKTPTLTQSQAQLVSDKSIALSSIFVATDEYGTRSTSLVLFSKDGGVRFIEGTHQPGSVDIRLKEIVI
jgi:uncharacterized protein with NRDE domain